MVSESSPSSDPAKRWRDRRIVRWVGFALAIGLLGGSVYYAVRGGNFGPLFDAEWKWLAALLGVTALSAVGINGLLFWLVYKPFADADRPIHLHHMLLIISASALLNYTPFKAGLVGRAAYVKHRHGISYTASVLIHLMIAGALFAGLLGMLGVTLVRPQFDWLWWMLLILSVPMFALIGAVMVQRMMPKRGDGTPEAGEDVARLRHTFGWSVMHLSAWIIISHVLLLVTAVRWWLVCGVMEQAVSVRDALWMAITHSFCTLLPANGLGMREWLIGYLFGGAAPADFVAISLIDRAAEAMIVIPAGLAGIWWLNRMARKSHGRLQQRVAEGGQR